jgi:hypothetical protein
LLISTSTVQSNGAQKTNVFLRKSVWAGHLKNVTPFLLDTTSFDNDTKG